MYCKDLTSSFTRHVGFHATSCACPPRPLLRLISLCQTAPTGSSSCPRALHLLCTTKVHQDLLRVFAASSVRCAEHYFTRSARLRCSFAVRYESIGCSRIPSPLQGSGAPSRSLAELLIGGRAEIDDLIFECTEGKFRIPRTSSATGREKGPAPRGVGSERPSSQSTQIAKQNRSTGAPAGRSEGLCYTRPSAEHTIWRSEVRRKEGRGGHAHASGVEPDMSIEATCKVTITHHNYAI